MRREHRRQPLEVHRLVQAVADRLRHQRMIGDLPVARNVLQAGGRIGEHRGHQIVGHHPLQLRRDLPAVAVARDGERNGRVPAPAGLKHRRVEECLDQHVAGGGRVQIPEDVGQRKRMLRTEREEQGVLGGRRLQFEVELAAEALAKRQTPRLVDAAPERGVQHQLHAARFVEESLEDEDLLCRQHAERAPRVRKVGDGLFRGDTVEAGLRRRVHVATLRSSSRFRHGSAERRHPLAAGSISARRSLTARDSSSLRAGASPSQNGIFGGAPLASATRTVPEATCNTRQDALPS